MGNTVSEAIGTVVLRWETGETGAGAVIVVTGAAYATVGARVTYSTVGAGLLYSGTEASATCSMTGTVVE